MRGDLHPGSEVTMSDDLDHARLVVDTVTALFEDLFLLETATGRVERLTDQNDDPGFARSRQLLDVMARQVNVGVDALKRLLERQFAGDGLADARPARLVQGGGVSRESVSAVQQKRSDILAMEDAGAAGAVHSSSLYGAEEASTMVDSHGISFPVGHSVSPARLAELTGAFVHDDPSYVQATGFVLDPDGRVLLGTYSTGAVGRLTAPDAVGFIKYARSSG